MKATICNKCKQPKSGRCKSCRAEWAKTHYHIHRDTILQDHREYNQAHRQERKLRDDVRRDEIVNVAAAYRLRYGPKIRQQRKSYYKTLHGFTAKLWGSLNSRTENGSHPNRNNRRTRSYIEHGIRLEMTRNELAEVICSNWSVIQEIFNAGSVPSIDRWPDTDGHYTLGNVRFIPLKDNIREGNRLRCR